MTIFDDHRVPARTLEEIEAEAERCRQFAQRDPDGRIDVFELLKALKVELVVESDAKMGSSEAYSTASAQQLQQILCRRSISKGLRFGDPHARYVVGHELGHMFLHRGNAPKALKIGGNQKLTFISEEESAERQAWKFARALFVSRLDLTSGESDESVAIRVGIPSGAVTLRRQEVRQAMEASKPKTLPGEVERYLAAARLAQRQAESAAKATARADVEKRVAWDRAATLPDEDPGMVRSARGFRIEWNCYELPNSQVGWTLNKGEARAFMDLQSR